MTREQKIEVYVQNRELIEIYGKLLELARETGNEKVKRACIIIDNAIDVLSEV